MKGGIKMKKYKGIVTYVTVEDTKEYALAHCVCAC